MRQHRFENSRAPPSATHLLLLALLPTYNATTDFFMFLLHLRCLHSRILPRSLLLLHAWREVVAERQESELCVCWLRRPRAPQVRVACKKGVCSVMQ